MAGPRRDIPLIQILPNLMTVAAICAGITSIRFGIQGNFVLAVQLILAACVLDGLDGRLARLLESDSQIGAELDSLADFLNFGVAPPLLIYYWALHDMPRLGWIAVLVYTVCCVVRLARFNVTSKSEDIAKDDDYFIGVPSPAGALLVLLPMFVSFAFKDARLLPVEFLCFYTVVIAALLISPFPTLSFKKARIPQDQVMFVLIGFAVTGAAVLTYPWITLVVMTSAYVGVVIWSLIKWRRK